jgi:hypothetical protein
MNKCQEESTSKEAQEEIELNNGGGIKAALSSSSLNHSYNEEEDQC